MIKSTHRDFEMPTLKTKNNATKGSTTAQHPCFCNALKKKNHLLHSMCNSVLIIIKCEINKTGCLGVMVNHLASRNKLV